eukprot:11006_1
MCHCFAIDNELKHSVQTVFHVSIMLLFATILCIFITLLNSQPAQDACQLVNATEPSECPKQIGPPCPPCVINESPSYKTGDPLVITQQTRNSIQLYTNQYLNYWLKNYPPSRDIPLNDPTSIVEGATGRALIFLRMYNYTQNKTYLNTAASYIANTMKHIANMPATASYMVGHSGVYIVAAQIAQQQNNANDMKKYIANLVDVFSDVNTAIINGDKTSPKYKFDMTDGCDMTGLGGLLYSGILSNKYFGKTTISNEYITNLAHYLVILGLDTAKAAGVNKEILLYKFGYEAGCYVPGASEGNGGTVKMLLEAYYHGYVPDLMTNKTYHDAIMNTLNWFIDIQLSDGNIPTYTDDNIGRKCANVYGNDNDARVQWCHGAPGFIDTLSLGAVVFDSIGETEKNAIPYLNAALKAYNATWERGLLIKGLMQCHGIGGNTYTILHMYKNLKRIQSGSKTINDAFDVSFLMDQSLWRGIHFVEFTLNQANLNVLRTEYSNEDYSAWLGSYGIPWLYVQSIQNGWPASEPICMVGWDFCGM